MILNGEALSCSKRTISIIKRNNTTVSGLPSFFYNRKKKHESHKIVCENKDFCNVSMFSEDIKIIESNKYQKSVEAPFVTCADLECLIEKIDGCKNNPENSSTTKVSEHIPSDPSMSTMLSFKSIEN